MRRLAFISVFALLALAAVQAHATLITKMGVAELTVVADVILRGTVEAVTTDVDATTGRPTTTTTLVSEQVYKGQPQTRVHLRQIGGTVNGKTLWVAGTPRFEVGEEVLVFLGSFDGHHVLRGMGQGAFQITRAGGQPQARQMLETVSLISQSADGARKIEPAQPLVLPLTELEATIHAALASAPAKEGN